jgi:hypothetical protein
MTEQRCRPEWVKTADDESLWGKVLAKPDMKQHTYDFLFSSKPGTISYLEAQRVNVPASRAPASGNLMFLTFSD